MLSRMTWTAPEVERVQRPYIAGERAMLDGALDFQRQTLMAKCARLTADQLKQRAAEPSSMSLLGLVRHLAGVERWWFRRNFAGQQLDDLYCSVDNPDGEFDDVETADAEADLALWATEVELAREVAVGHSLDETFIRAPHALIDRPPAELSLRWVYVNMLEEYARHNGHADVLRERIDGATGA